MPKRHFEELEGEEGTDSDLEMENTRPDLEENKVYCAQKSYASLIISALRPCLIEVR